MLKEIEKSIDLIKISINRPAPKIFMNKKMFKIFLKIPNLSDYFDVETKFENVKNGKVGKLFGIEICIDSSLLYSNDSFLLS